MQFEWTILAAVLPLVAMLYASVGHGGASSYLMLLALLGFAPEEIRPTALVLNMVVSLLAFASYGRAAPVPARSFIPLIALSMPAAFLGGTIQVDPTLYKKILGALLLLPVFRFSGIFAARSPTKVTPRGWMYALLGLGIGFVSGLIGIGGGIILSPVLLMLGWATVKEAAAISALFIFLNSVAGFVGAYSNDLRIGSEVWGLMVLAAGGGMVGAYVGAHRLQVTVLKYLLSAVLLIASTKLIFS